jgi:hypothetical protein
MSRLLPYKSCCQELYLWDYAGPTCAFQLDFWECARDDDPISKNGLDEFWEPSRLRQMFIVEAAQSGGHHCALAEISKGSAMVGAIDHGQASNIIAQHLEAASETSSSG